MTTLDASGVRSASAQGNVEEGVWQKVSLLLPGGFERARWIAISCHLEQPGGETAPRSSLNVMVGIQPWEEQIDLIGSESDDEHFIVETDELQRSQVRFGNNINGRALPAGSLVTCAYQVGQGAIGNVGADKLTGYDVVSFPEVTQTWNPLDVTDEDEKLGVVLVAHGQPVESRSGLGRQLALAGAHESRRRFIVD